MSDSEHDDEFEAYLKRRVPINKGASPSDPLEPPPELDRIVIGNARKAIQGAAPVPLYRAPKWALPVGLAATIVISFVVVLDLGLRAKHQKEADAVAQEPVAMELYADAPDAVTPAPATGAPNVARRGGRPTTARHIKLPPIPTIPWPPAVTSNTTRVAEATEQPSIDPARTRLARAEVAAARSRTDTESSADVSAEAAAEGSGTPASPPPASPQVARSRSPMAGSATGEHPDPATWLSQIEKLRNEGRAAEAEQELKHFRAVYPSYPTSSADARAQ